MTYSVNKVIALIMFIFFTVANAGLPWLVSEDEKTSWFSGPSTKCYFAREWYSIGQSFCPVLSPFGRMPCMNCTCLKHPQFAFLRPRVSCRNVRSECPLVSCADPVIKEGECCPSCHSEYISLLLPISKSSMESNIGGLHLTLGRNSLFVSFKLERTEDIIGIKMKDKLLERTYHSANERDFKASRSDGKVCVEAKLPKALSIREMVYKKDLLIEIETRDAMVYRGLLAPYHMFSEVPFVGLLSPYKLFLKKPHVAAGIVSMSGDKQQQKISIRIAVLFQPGDIQQFSGNSRGGNVVVKILKRPWKPDKLSPVLKTYSIRVRRDNILSGKLLVKQLEWKNPRAAHLRWMVRGLIFVTVDFKWEIQRSRLFGRVLVHDSCRKFYSVLNGGGLDPQKSTTTSGIATLNYGAKSKLHYKVVGKGIAKAHKMDVLAVDVYDKVLKRLTTIRRNPDEDTFKVSGVWEKPSAEAVNLLFKGGFFIKVISNIKAKDGMRGRMKQTLYLNEADYGQASIVSIHDVDTKAASKVSAVAVFSTDSNCNIHYVIDLGGYSETSTAHQLIYAVLRLDGMYNGGKTESTDTKMVPFNKNYLACGSIMNPSEELLIGISAGMAQIEIHTRRFVSKELKGYAKFAHNSCTRIEKNKGASYLQRSLVGSDLNVGVCLHQGRFYDHGTEWHPLERDGKTKMYCVRCKCNRRHVTCKQISCPKLKCDNPVSISEHCCPVCISPPNNRAVDPREACIIGMASRSDIKAVGEAWHPVVPPFGMIKCIVCICKSAPGNRKCSRVICPKLDCKSSIKPQGSCCPICQTRKNPEIQRKPPHQGSLFGKKKAGCLYGEKRYVHGTSWKPILPQFGMLRCVTCRCKNGRVRCRKLRCSKSARCRLRVRKAITDPCCKHCTHQDKTQ